MDPTSESSSHETGEAETFHPLRLTGWKSHILPLGLLFLLALASLGQPLFSAVNIISSASGDVASQYLYTRGFGFTEMAGGNIPLWNPYLFGGVPFLGDFQSALLYPLNLIFLILPLPVAINWSFAIHIFILGASMYTWGVAGRSLGICGGILAGVAAMFGAAFFLHIHAGHLSNVCSMAWTPLIFLGIDGWLHRRHAGWIILAAAAAALQVYAGHPQYVYFTALVVGLYSLLHLPKTPRLKSACFGLLLIYPLAGLLSAVQLLPGIDAASESTRAVKSDYAFAAMFSFPPENLLTLAVPWLFGNVSGTTYWGRCYLWEMSLFTGCGMLFLALWGAWAGSWRSLPWRILGLIAACFLLALGTHTPLHQLLFQWLPGFDFFRGSSKFIFFVGLFMALLAGMGAQRLMARELAPRVLCALGGLLGLLLLLGAWGLTTAGGHEMLHGAIQKIASTKEVYFRPEFFETESNLNASLDVARASLLMSGVLMLGFSLLLFATRKWSILRWAIFPAVVVELFVFAHSTVVTFPMTNALYLPLAETLRKIPGDFRILNLFNPDASIVLRREGIWGYEPSVLRRYSQLVRLSQGTDQPDPSNFLRFHQPHPILDLLRCRFVALPKEAGVELVPIGSPFPRYSLLTDFKVLPPGEVLEELREPVFDLRSKVLLEQPPVPSPDKKLKVAKISLLGYSTDHQIVEVLCDAPAILLITDAYSKDWRVSALPGSAQISYKMIPADHAVRAIPLAEGRHVLRMEYVPAGLPTGVSLTLLSLVLCGLAIFVRPFKDYLRFPLP